MKDALLLHDGIVRNAIERHGGRVFKTIGDAFCAVFESVLAAIEAALDVQRQLVVESFEAVDGLTVRIAIHVGRAEERDDDYFGTTVNRVARLLAVAHGGQIVLTRAAVEDVGDGLPVEVSFRDLGQHRLRDLKVPEQITDIVARGLRSAFPAPRSLNSYTNNLPLQLTELIGRRVDIGELERKLGESRLVTIVGPGGVGKTRVALQVAAELTERFADGVWFVDLAPLRDGAYVASAFAVAVGFAQTTDGSLVDGLIAHLRAKRLLLVVDNCEHLIDESANVVSRLVRECADLSILATTRERLNVPGERVYALPTLSVPPTDAVSDLMRFDAYALFVDRASAANASFAPGDNDGVVVADICRRLDGIPFAIELAAARVRVLTPTQIVDRLDERLRLLTSSSRTNAPRQQTIRAMIDWTYDSLAIDERRLFARLSIFAGGWTLEAAEVVCADESDDARDTVDTLASLIDKSLVYPEIGYERMRFNMHETTRVYAVEKLVQQGDRDRTADAHASWLAKKITTDDPTFGTIARRYSDDAFRENDNVRAALEWTLRPTGDRRIAARIAAGAASMWYDAGLHIEGSAWIESLLSDVRAEDARDLALTAALWRGLARLSVAKRLVDAAERALAIHERLDDSPGIASSLIRLAFGYWQIGSMDLAEAAVDRALELLRSGGREESSGYADALDTRGSLYLNLGRHDEARASMEEALAIYRLSGDEFGAARVRGNLAELSFARGDTASALEYVTLAVEIFHRMRSPTRECMALANSAAYRLAVDDIDRAERDAHIALRIARRIGDAQVVAAAVQHVATIEIVRGRPDEALMLLGFVDEWYRRQGYAREWSEARGRATLASRLESSLDAERIRRGLIAGARLDIAHAVGAALASKTSKWSAAF